MKTLTTAGILLAFLLAGCTMNGPNRGTSANSTSSMQRDSANYHADNFGEPDNTPFQGVYPAR